MSYVRLQLFLVLIFGSVLVITDSIQVARVVWLLQGGMRKFVSNKDSRITVVIWELDRVVDRHQHLTWTISTFSLLYYHLATKPKQTLCLHMCNIPNMLWKNTDTYLEYVRRLISIKSLKMFLSSLCYLSICGSKSSSSPCVSIG